jgi:phosphatidylglycerophosphate synthase
VRAVRSRLMTGLIAQIALLMALAEAVGLSGIGWLIGMTCGLITNAALARGLAQHGADRLGPADRVTLVRATVAGGVAALVADSFWRPISVTMLLTLVVIALVLDGVDGWVARHTETSSPLGARFDMEVDAFLILVLSGYVAQSAGAWVLAIGAARYLSFAAGLVVPWLRGSVPPRYWAKVVAVIQAVVLTVAAADVLPHSVIVAALAVSLALLVESFGRDVQWLRQAARSRQPVASVPVRDDELPRVPARAA